MNTVQPGIIEQHLLAETFGATLSTETKYEKAHIWCGPGANGKSVTGDILSCLVGRENSVSLELKDFSSRFRSSMLVDKLLCLASETDVNSLVNDSEIKKIITGEPVVAEMKHRDPFEFRPYATIVVLGNSLPRTNDRSDGWRRRWLILPWSVQIPPERMDLDLKRKLLDEAPGILNWALGGLVRLRRQNGFTIPESSVAAGREYQRQIAPELLFIDERLTAGTTADFAYIKDVYTEYQTFCKENGFNHPVSRPLLVKQVKRQFGLHPEASWKDRRGYYIEGVRFAEPTEREHLRAV